MRLKPKALLRNRLWYLTLWVLEVVAIAGLDFGGRFTHSRLRPPAVHRVARASVTGELHRISRKATPRTCSAFVDCSAIWGYGSVVSGSIDEESPEFTPTGRFPIAASAKLGET